MSRTALIDADLVCYMACMSEGGEEHAVRMTHDEDATPLTTDAVKRAVDTADLRIETWCKFVDADDVTLAFTDGENFRKSLSPYYKAKRTEKPEIYDEVERTVRMNYLSVSYPKLEGDDVLGLMQTEANHIGKETIVISGDKDIKTIPGLLYHVPHWTRLKREDYGKVEFNPELEADRFWMMQTLMGDTTDGYSGCPGVGPKRAKEVLKRCTSIGYMWGEVISEYTKKAAHKTWGKKFVHGNAWNEAIINARCARILREGDYNMETKEVNLWKP